MTQSILVSLHMPKTAGTSFAAALQAYFGERYRADYADMPMQVSPWIRHCRALREALRLRGTWSDDIACVHGHFLPFKYRYALRGHAVQYVTWLRDPVERIVSHYHYWRRDYDGSDPKQALRNRVLNERWSLERFALGPEMRNLYSQYLWRFDPCQFAFIGITERYAQDLERFAATYTDGGLILENALRNPDRDEEAYPISSALRARIADHHAVDVDLYQSVVRARGDRLPTHSSANSAGLSPTVP